MERGENVDGAVPGRLPSRFQESDSGRDGAVVDALNRLVETHRLCGFWKCCDRPRFDGDPHGME